MISVIIPVYNEEKFIKETLSSLFSNDKSIEVIVVDGLSLDATLEVVEQFPVRIVRCVRNRAAQMNEGAKVARGEALLFLHADAVIENDSFREIEKNLENGFVGGCLVQKINTEGLVYRFIEATGNIRARLFRVFYGDQAIFVRRDVFFEIGGFSEVELFDDVIFSKKLNVAGKTIVLGKKVIASARRWQRQGVVKTTLINWMITVGFLLGVSPRRLKRLYCDVR
jgi:rSAM/selenodomain-associated transferase 2